MPGQKEEWYFELNSAIIVPIYDCTMYVFLFAVYRISSHIIMLISSFKCIVLWCYIILLLYYLLLFFVLLCCSFVLFFVCSFLFQRRRCCYFFRNKILHFGEILRRSLLVEKEKGDGALPLKFVLYYCT